MSQIIAITNQKGGVGKTTTSINLAASLGAIKQRVLLVDLDPQGNATVGSGVWVEEGMPTISELLLGTDGGSQWGQTPRDVSLPNEEALHVRVGSHGATTIEDVITHCNGYDLLPANGRLTTVELNLINEIGREYRLRELFAPLKKEYDFILIDCPPSLNILTINALVAATSVLIPMQCEYYAMEGLAALLNTIKRLRETANPTLQIEGVLRTMYDGRNRLTQEVSHQLFEHFGEKVYQAVIPRNVRLAEAPSHGLPALQYDKRSQGAAAYLALAAEMVRRHSTEDIACKNQDSVAV